MTKIIDTKEENAYFISKNNMIVNVNPLFKQIVGYDTVLGMHIEELWKLIDIQKYNNGYVIVQKNSLKKYINIEVYESLDRTEKTYVFREKRSNFEEVLNLTSLINPSKINGFAIFSVPELRLIYCNEKQVEIYEELSGTKINPVGKTIFQLFSDFRERDLYLISKKAIKNNESIFLKDYRFDTADGSTKYWDVVLTPVANMDKKYLCVICNDVTESVLNKQRIEEQNRLLQSIIDNISEEIFIFDKDGNYIKFNKITKENGTYANMKKIYDGYTQYDYYDLLNNKIKKEDFIVTRVMKGEKVTNEVVISHDSGERYLCLSGQPVFDETGNLKMGVMTLKDVSNDILYQQTITRQLNMLYQVIHNLDLPLLRVTYPDLKIIDINPRAFKLAKSKAHNVENMKDMLGKKFETVFSNFTECHSYKNIYECAKEKKTKNLKNCEYIIDGKKMYANLIYEPILGFNGQVEQVVVLVIDVTSERQESLKMENMLLKQEEFFTNISHELKTPLNVIYATAQLFDMFCKSDSLDSKKEYIIKYIKTIIQNCYRLSKLINNIVDLSKIEAGYYELNKTNENVVNVLEEIVMSVVQYSESKGINIIFDTNVEEKIIACDSEKIERIVLNLISNAIKFSDKGDDILVEFFDMGDFVEISVTDKGTGIDRDKLETIFERFKQADKSLSRNAEGTGIGLSLVKALVELHGGIIKVESEQGEGSKFTVRLPAEEVEEIKPLVGSDIMRSNNHIVSIELSDINR
ncbi:MAG: PAS domain-containing sensor histidine kinase [Bacillota bacterium]|nr:PAS domain-containing sensor histidine kinase [Bacillota bacterium]